MNLYYTALPVGQGCVPSLPQKYQVDNSCCSLTFFPQRCGTCGYRRPLEKGETVYDTQQIGVGKAWTLQDCWAEWSPSLTCKASLKVISNYEGRQNSSQPDRRICQSFLQNPAGYQSTVSLPHAAQFFEPKLLETCFMSNLVEIYWRHVRDFFQRIAGVCFGTSSNTDPTFQGFIHFFYSKDSKGEIWFKVGRDVFPRCLPEDWAAKLFAGEVRTSPGCQKDPAPDHVDKWGFHWWLQNIDYITYHLWHILLPKVFSFFVVYPGLSEQTTRGAKCCQHGA